MTRTNVTLARWWKAHQQQRSHCSLSITAANVLRCDCSWKPAGCKSSRAKCLAQLNVAQMKWKEWRACRAPNNKALITYNFNHNWPVLSVVAVGFFTAGCRYVTPLTLHFAADMESKREEKIKFWFSGAVGVFGSNGRGEWLQSRGHPGIDLCLCCSNNDSPRWDMFAAHNVTDPSVVEPL